MDIALEIGHTPASGGAAHVDTHLTEYDFNQTLARCVAGHLPKVDPVITGRDWGDPNGSRLPDKLNGMDLDAVVALHANAYKHKALGCETLYWPDSEGGQVLAELLVDHFHEALGNPLRGAKGRREGRGAYFLKNTEMVYVLAEPFFIDETEDLHLAQKNLGSLAWAYAESIRLYVKEFG